MCGLEMNPVTGASYRALRATIERVDPDLQRTGCERVVAGGLGEKVEWNG